MRIKAFVTVLGAVLLWVVLQTAQAYNFTAPYSHYADGEDLTALLQDFGHHHSLQVQTSGKVSGVVSGRFDKIPSNQFLDGLRAAYGVRYYKLGDTLFFYHESEWAQKVLHPGQGSDARQLADYLNQSGLVPAELPVKLQNGGKLLVLQGPPSLTSTLEAMLANYERSPHVKHVMEVFRLKHANAADRQVSVMDKTIVVPGVATILNAMVGKTDPEAAKVQVSTQSASAGKLGGTGLASQGKEQKPKEKAAEVGSTQGSPDTEAVSILADNRLNAVVVNDLPYRIPYYRKVIAELDQPVKLVEIHAAIVDVDVERTKDLGIDWQARRRFSSKFSIGGGVGDASNAWDGNSWITPSNVSSGMGIFSTVFSTSRTNFFAQVNMLESEQQARTLGMPSVLTFDNVEATLEDTTTSYIKVEGKDAADLFKVEAGTVLQVTPHIVEDPKGGVPLISMQVKLQSNQENNDNITSSGTAIPPIKQTKINTQALVRQGQSLLLGGYYVEYSENTSQGVPGAKDVSFLGKLFGSEGTNKYRRERLIVITPRVLELGELQQLPDDLDHAAFAKSPTQDSFINRPVKAPDSSGCSSNRASGTN